MTWMPATPGLPAAPGPATPFARTPGRPRVHGGPEPTKTDVRASVVALVDTQATADAMAAALKHGESPRSRGAEPRGRGAAERGCAALTGVAGSRAADAHAGCCY